MPNTYDPADSSPAVRLVPYAPLEADPSDPTRDTVDVASTPWEGVLPRALARDVAAHVTKGKDAAAANVLALPELKEVWAGTFASLRAVRDANAFKELLDAPDDEWRLLPVALTRPAAEQLATGVDGVIQATRAKLATLATALAAQSLDPVERRVTDADTRWWNDLLPSLHVLTATAALPILRRALVTDAIKTSRYGRHELALPWLRSVYDTDPRWHREAVRQLLTDAEAVRLDVQWHTRRRADLTIRRTDHQLSILGTEFVRTRGVIARSPWTRGREAVTALTNNESGRRMEPGASFLGAFAGVDAATDPADERVADHWAKKAAAWRAQALRDGA